MKLYYTPGACSLADHIALIESSLPFETERVDLKTKITASGADYRRINPKAYVPALALDDGNVLTENVAILSYIAEKAGGLMPDGDLGRFRTLEALAFISSELHKGFKPFFVPSSGGEEKAAARALLTRRFALFEPQVEHQAYLLGPKFGVADCYLFVMLQWAETKAGLTLPPNLAAYFGRLEQRDAVKRALADENPV